MSETYKIQAFAQLAGITVRTLHHYDRIGLLKPQRTASGYRVYGMRELERLEQVAALRFLGLPLREIKFILEREKRLMPEILAAQRRELEAKREQLCRALSVIGELEKAVKAGNPTATLLTKLIEEIDMQETNEFLNRYYSESAQATLEQRRKDWDPAQQDQVTADWRALYSDIRASLAEDPAGPRAQALLARWQKLIEAFTGGDAEVRRGLGKVWADKHNWPADIKQQNEEFSDPAIWKFIKAAQEAQR